MSAPLLRLVMSVLTAEWVEVSRNMLGTGLTGSGRKTDGRAQAGLAWCAELRAEGFVDGGEVSCV